MAKKKNNNLWYILGGVVILVLVLWIILANVNNAPKSYCGDSVCDSNENECSCSSDCGSCYGERNCNYYTCNYNDECVVDYALDNCCGNNKCEAGESCSSCSSDCGSCSPISSSWEAIEKISAREDIKEIWTSMATAQNCGAKYLNMDNAVMSICRVTLSQDLIDCQTRNSFYDFLTLAQKEYLLDDEIIFKIDENSESLIEDFNKAIRGYEDIKWTAPLEETCDNCNDFYAIYLGCIDSDIDVNNPPSSGMSSGLRAFVVVDRNTGVVYW